MNKPLITTLIPTYQRPQLLKRALKSVLAQTEKRFLVHVYDNASQDETPEIVAEFQDSRIKYVRHPTNIGLFENFKAGLPHLTTPYFSFLSDDDFLFPWFYETALKEYEKYPDIGFAATRTLTIDEKGKIEPFHQVHHALTDGYFKPIDGTYPLLKSTPLWTGILFKTEILKKLESLNPIFGHAFDFDFTLRASLHFPFSYVKKVSACYLSWPKGASYSLNYYNCWLGYQEVTSNILKEKICDKKLKTHIRKMQCIGLKKLSLKHYIEKKDEAKIFLPILKEYQIPATFLSFLLRFPICRPFISALRTLRKNLLLFKCKIKLFFDPRVKGIRHQIRERL